MDGIHHHQSLNPAIKITMAALRYENVKLINLSCNHRKWTWRFNLERMQLMLARWQHKPFILLKLKADSLPALNILGVMHQAKAAMREMHRYSGRQRVLLSYFIPLQIFQSGKTNYLILSRFWHKSRAQNAQLKWKKSCYIYLFSSAMSPT